MFMTLLRIVHLEIVSKSIGQTNFYAFMAILHIRNYRVDLQSNMHHLYTEIPSCHYSKQVPVTLF